MVDEKKGTLTESFSKFNKLSNTAKITIISGITLCSVAVAVGFLYSGKSNDVVLFSQLSANDASEITTKLDEMKTKYKIKEAKDGTMTIYVDESKSAMARMEVSATFQPESGVVGYELLDSTSFGETQSDRDQKRIIALQGELTKTLQKLPFVDWARVHINVATNSFLEVNENESTASITLQLTQGTVLKKEQVMGIIKMIANGVQGLKPENIEVIDTNANVLSAGIFTDEGDFDSSDENLSLEKEKEKITRDKIQRLLDTVVGKGNSIVEVDLDLNMNKTEIAEQTLGDKVAVSEKEITKDTEINQNNTAAPGVDSNSDQEDYLANENNNGTNKENYAESQTNYEIEKRNETTVIAKGAINKMTVSVVVDESALVDSTGAVNNQLKSELIENIKNAAGFDAERNDQVSLTVAPFNKDVENEALDIIKSENTKNIISKVLIAIVTFGAFGALGYLIKKSTDSIKALKKSYEEESEELNIATLSTDASSPEIDGIANNEDLLLIEQRVNKTIDSSTEEVVKAVRFMMNASNK